MLLDSEDIQPVVCCFAPHLELLGDCQVQIECSD